jgi:hypothetical protein
MPIRDLQPVAWQRSTYCNSGNCVEVALLDDNRIAVRNSAKPADSPMVISVNEWNSFLAAIKKDKPSSL